MTEDYVHITPTVLYRARGGKLATVTANTEEGRALVVFRSGEEAERYREHTGSYPEGEGFKPVCVDHKDLANILEMHGCTHVAMPEPWTGEGGVDRFKAADFIAMLEESIPA
jgi:hypothetical protein